MIRTHFLLAALFIFQAPAPIARADLENLRKA
jgi:hypothetical protein